MTKEAISKIRLTDKHTQFAYDIASGMKQADAWKRHFGKKSTKMSTASVQGCLMMKDPKIQELVQKARGLRDKEINDALLRQLPQELQSSVILTTDHLDNFHYSVIKGDVEVEEVIPVTTITKSLEGREVKRTTSFMRVKRKPNIKERQASVDAIYKRFGNYAPSKIFGAMGKVNDEGELENVQRFVLLSDGSKIELP